MASCCSIARVDFFSNGNLLGSDVVWINSANSVEILWGEARGRANGPGGDGEIASYNSQAVKIYGTYVTNSGASAIYLVNCDNCAVENATITEGTGRFADATGSFRVDRIGSQSTLMSSGSLNGTINLGH